MGEAEMFEGFGKPAPLLVSRAMAEQINRWSKNKDLLERKVRWMFPAGLDREAVDLMGSLIQTRFCRYPRLLVHIQASPTKTADAVDGAGVAKPIAERMFGIGDEALVGAWIDEEIDRIQFPKAPSSFSYYQRNHQLWMADLVPMVHLNPQDERVVCSLHLLYDPDDMWGWKAEGSMSKPMVRMTGSTMNASKTPYEINPDEWSV